MENLDDLLEKEIELLQSGHSADEMIKDLPAEASELIPLIRLASNARAVTRPILKPQVQQEQKSRILRVNQPSRRSGFRLFKHPLNLRPAVGAAAMAVIAYAVIGLSIVTSASVNFATISDATGPVEVTLSSSDSSWKEIHPGEKIIQGQTIRTNENTTATIEFRDGSKSILSGATEIRLDTVGRTFWNSIQVELYQESGVTTHSVVPIHGQDGYFRVKTPYGTASVHGTVFQVDVRSNSRFSVTQGKVSVGANQKEVLLTNGQATIVQASAAPQDPAYQFSFSEELSSTGNLWTAGGVSFQVPADILSGDNFTPGEDVKVVGRIENGEYIADRITHNKNDGNSEKKDSQMTGVIESISSDQWVISGQSIQIEASTRLPDAAKVGDPVSIHFRMTSDHLKHATAITLLSSVSAENEKDPHSKRSTPEFTDTPLSENIDRNPDKISTPLVPTETTSPTTIIEQNNPKDDCSNGIKIPSGVDEIVTKYQRPIDEVTAWICQGYDIGEIGKAYNLSARSGASVSDLLAMRTSGMGWGQIEQSLDQKSSQNSGNSKNKKTQTP
jgi:hypothetical protein